MAWQNIATGYTQTVLGPLWFVVQPLFITAVFGTFSGAWRISARTISRITSFIWAGWCRGDFSPNP